MIGAQIDSGVRQSLGDTNLMFNARA